MAKLDSILIQFAFCTHMVSTGLGPWKMEPSDQDLTRFLRVKKQKLVCRTAAALVSEQKQAGLSNGESHFVS